MREKTNCLKFADALCYCYTPPHQLGNFYMNGEIDDCKRNLSNLMTCLKLKTKSSTRTEAEKKDLIDKMWMKNDYSPTNHIWEFRQDPRNMSYVEETQMI
eukprot:snap_masked-scaffold_8-processed-gene-8.18-mRNA-1 protein AED:1.00 eAED:1.00 QI:0/0/0/0/1/1/2/0/99